MIKAVFIDIDDTLLDFAPTCEAALKEGFEKFGIGPYKDGMVNTLLDVTAEMWKEIEKEEITYDYLLKERFNRVFARLKSAF